MISHIESSRLQWLYTSVSCGSLIKYLCCYPLLIFCFIYFTVHGSNSESLSNSAAVSRQSSVDLHSDDVAPSTTKNMQDKTLAPANQNACNNNTDGNSSTTPSGGGEKCVKFKEDETTVKGSWKLWINENPNRIEGRRIDFIKTSSSSCWHVVSLSMCLEKRHRYIWRWTKGTPLPLGTLFHFQWFSGKIAIIIGWLPTLGLT